MSVCLFKFAGMHDCVVAVEFQAAKERVSNKLKEAQTHLADHDYTDEEKDDLKVGSLFKLLG